MGIKAYIDDSYDRVTGTYVLAGCISSDELWNEFTDEWLRILPRWGVLNNNDDYHFHAAEMNRWRPENIPIFLTTIERYIHGILYIKINIYDLQRALNRILVQGTLIETWEGYAKPFYFSLRGLMDLFHKNRRIFPAEFFGDSPTDFIFDEQHEERFVVPHWESYLSHRAPEIRQYYGERPVFTSDDQAIPLQAADFFAWWCRKCFLDHTPESIPSFQYPGFVRERPRPIFTFGVTYNEDQLITELVGTVKRQLPLSSTIIVNPYFDHLQTHAPPGSPWLWV